MQIIEVMDLAEELNKITEKYAITLERVYVDVEDKEEIAALCRLQSVNCHQPTPELPNTWCFVTLGKVDFKLTSSIVKFEFKIVE